MYLYDLLLNPMLRNIKMDTEKNTDFLHFFYYYLIVI